MSRRKMITSSHFRGFVINCNEDKPVYQSCLDSMINQALCAKNIFKEPIGYHVVVRVGDTSIDKFLEKMSRRFKTYYRNANIEKIRNGRGDLSCHLDNYTFAYTWARECDADAVSYHYHLTLIIDGRYSKFGWVQNYFAESVREGSLVHYDCSWTEASDLEVAKDNKYYKMTKDGGIRIKSNMEDWVHRCSYFAKVYTKPDEGRTFGSNYAFGRKSNVVKPTIH